MTGPLLGELAMRMQELQAGAATHTAFLYFGHSESTNTLLPALGLYRDPAPLTAADWAQHHHAWQVDTHGV